MTAENPPLEPQVEVPAAAAIATTPFVIALVVIALAAVGGWLHTVRELNRLVAYELVRSEALRQTRSVDGRKPSAAESAAKQQRHSERPGDND